jgi:hypothetical protein
MPRTAPAASVVEQRRLTGERALYGATDLRVAGSVFADGESPLKESSGVHVDASLFEWKYPLWYAQDVDVADSALLQTARSGIWYTDGIRVIDSTIQAPKTFRRSRRIHLERVDLPHADETLWSYQDVQLTDVTARGDYFAMNSSRIRADGLRLSGSYAFDGARDVEVSGARVLSKDAFWNCEDVVVRDSLVVGEYLGWNSRNLTFRELHDREPAGPVLRREPHAAQLPAAEHHARVRVLHGRRRGHHTDRLGAQPARWRHPGAGDR